jgi:hypothetical protein
MQVAVSLQDKSSMMEQHHLEEFTRMKLRNIISKLLQAEFSSRKNFETVDLSLFFFFSFAAKQQLCLTFILYRLLFCSPLFLCNL